jgi:hypothetical protein
MILTRNRSNILRGSVTISGNEYMQPGEVVFIEDRNLLFYVNSVRHSMTQGSGFTTTLELTYGHSIGEYIPTYMDTIGKLIYKNREVVATIIQRQDSSAPEQNIGVVQLDPKNKGAPITFTGNKGDFVSSFSESNTTVINNILYNTAYLIRANGTKGNNIKTKVELRVYHDSKTGVDSQLLKQANGVMQMLTGVSQGPVNFFGQNQPVQNFTLDKKWVEIVKVNIDDEEDRRSPSQKAIDAARNQMAGASTNTGSISSSNPVGNDDGTNTNTISPDNRSLRKVLFSYIIDCWITFTQVSDEEANSI